ncbi:PTS transporter subunit EIIC [Frischella sp. Ac13]|uniref:protein-N(pi)-phosphohistidine--D-fructose phosphotransferase n=1 Tax=Frischella japonica TaxID=2741544 RepID=A0ABR7QYM5_9GAMM|nr:PTS transporter subunit EIIC [Frischella japonica]
MNIYIAITNQIGPAIARLAKAELTLAAKELNHTIVNVVTDAAVVVLIGQGTISDTTLNGKKVYTVMDIDQLFANPKQILIDTENKAEIYTVNTDVSSSDTIINKDTKRIVAVTACPTGVAHTFMAAEAIEEEAKKRGWWCKVETRGSVGVGNELTAEEIAAADIVIVACDIEVDLSKFAGKLMYRTKTGPALKKTAQEFDRAFAEAKIYQPESTVKTTQTSKEKKGIYQHLLTGISYMLPMVVAGGLIKALSFALGHFENLPQMVKVTVDNIEVTKEVMVNTLVGEAHLAQIGSIAFILMVPLLAGYIAYSIADRPGLVPGLVGGFLAAEIGAGFLGGIIAGYFAGYVALLLTRYIKLPQSMSSLKPILIVPLMATLIVGLGMQLVFGEPIAFLMKALNEWLKVMQHSTSVVILGAILGAMMCTDMGGPLNKAAYATGVGLIAEQQYAPMAAIMAAGMVPPLAMTIATIIASKKFNKTEQQSGRAAFVLGLCFISEGAIPFAARDPLRVIPSCIIGGAITGGLALLWETTLRTPHGGIFALLIPGVVDHPVKYLLAIAIGSLIGGIIYAMIKKPESQQEIALAEKMAS